MGICACVIDVQSNSGGGRAAASARYAERKSKMLYALTNPDATCQIGEKNDVENLEQKINIGYT